MKRLIYQVYTGKRSNLYDFCVDSVMAYAEKHNPDRKKSRCVSFLERTESELCEILKKNISLTKNKIIKHKIVKSSKIEDLAKNSDIHKRR